MVNYRIFNAKEITTGQSGSLDRAWGIMINTPICTGTLHLEGFTGATHTTMNLAYLPKNTPIPPILCLFFETTLLFNEDPSQNTLILSLI
jgi:hypothetical protein